MSDILHLNTLVCIINLQLFFNNQSMNTFVGVIQALQDERSTGVYIQLARTFLGEEEVKMISQLLKKNIKIEAMDLSDNNITHEGGKNLGEMLQENQKLVVIDLKYNNLGPRGVRCIADALEKNTTLKYISLVRNNIGQQGGEYILRMLDRNTTLGEIDLEGNGIDDRLMFRIKEKLAKNKGDWLSKELRVPHNSSTIYAMAFHQKKIGYEEADRIAHFIEQHPMLGEISLINNEMTEKEIKSLAQGLEYQRYLKSIIIQDNKEIQLGIKYLSEILEGNRSVIELIYNNNDAGPTGTKFVGQMLEKNQSLDELTLTGNNIGPTGAMYLAEGIENNFTIRKLDFSFNNLGDDGAQCFARMLEGNGSVTHLKLIGNNITDRGFKYLVQALQINTTLAVLDVGDNKIGDDGARYLIDLLERSSRATQVNLEANKVSMNWRIRIMDLARKNGHQIANLLSKKIISLEKLTDNADEATEVLDRGNPSVSMVVRKFQETKESQRAAIHQMKKSLQNKDKDIGVESMSVKVDQMMVIMMECLSEIKQIDPLREEAKDEIIHLFDNLKGKNFSLYVYCKTFFWTMLNLLGAYRHLSSNMMRQSGMTMSTSMRSNGGRSSIGLGLNMYNARQAAKYGMEIVEEGAPFNETTVRALDRIIEGLYMKYNRFEKKSEAINKIIRHKFEVEEDVAIHVAKIAIAMTNVKQQAILDNQIQSSWIRDEVTRIKNMVLPLIELKEGANNSAAILALEHVILLIAFLCLDSEQLIHRGGGLDLLCSDIIKQGALDRLLPGSQFTTPQQTPKSPGTRLNTNASEPVPVKKQTRGCTGSKCNMF